MTRAAIRSAWLVVAMICIDSAATAEERRPARLVYSTIETGADCPDETSFRALMLARLGRDPFSASAEDELAVKLEHKSGVYRGSFFWKRGPAAPASRTLTGRSCENVVDALATAAALAIDPASALGPPPATPPPATEPTAPAPAPASTTPPAPKVDAPAPPAPEPRTESGTRWRLAAGAAGIVGMGNLPSPSIGAQVSVGARTDAVTVSAEGRAETVMGAANEAGIRLEGTMLTGAFVPCLHLRPAFGCVVARGGVVQASSPDVTTPSLGSSAYGAGGARAGVAFPLGDALAIGAFGELIVPVVRTTLRANDRPVWTAPGLSGALGVGVFYAVP